MLKFGGIYNVIIVGGGPAGISAATAAARAGVKTLLVEKSGVLGSVASAGLCSNWLSFYDNHGNKIIEGIAQELIDRVSKVDETVGHVIDVRGALYSRTLHDPEAFKIASLEMVEEAGVDMLFHSVALDTIVEESEVKGIVLVNKSGVQTFLGDVIVDASGDGDIAYQAGAEINKENKSLLQPITLIFRMGGVDINKLIDYIKENPQQFEFSIDPSKLDNYPYFNTTLGNFPPYKEACETGKFPGDIVRKQCFIWTSGANKIRKEIYVNATRVVNVDGTNGWDISQAEIQLRKQVKCLVNFFKREVPGFNNAFLLQTASHLGVRETRRVVGEYIIKKEDVLNGRTFEDSIGKACSPIDIHGSKKEKDEFRWIKTSDGGVSPYQIPYRALVPKGDLNNLLISGRIVSSTRDANGSIRMMPVCSVTGQAAGTAAALALDEGISVRELPVCKLQETLRKAGQNI